MTDHEQGETKPAWPRPLIVTESEETSLRKVAVNFHHREWLWSQIWRVIGYAVVVLGLVQAARMLGLLKWAGLGP